MMRWVLIRPLNRSLFYDPEIQEPLGLEYLAAVLKKNGHQVLILDSALNNLDDQKLARRVIAFQPDAIGFSITTDRELESISTIYQECKRILNGTPILWIAGGNYVTTETENALRELPEEIHLAKYEGEIYIKEVCSLWENRKIHSLPRLTDGIPTIEMDNLPFPMRFYPYYLKNYGWAFNLQGSRGCCSACKYCASRGMRSKVHTSWRGRSPENMAEEIVRLYEQYGARAFNFVDEDFLGPPHKAPERARRFSEEILKHKLVITFGIQVRPNSLSIEVIDDLLKAGLKYVFMGIESDDPEDFKRWGRAYCKDTWEWVAYLQEKEIEVNAGTLLFHPDCTFGGIRNFAVKLHQYGLLNCRTAINRLDAMPGSYFYEEYMANHPAEVQGILQLPFKHPEVEPFYRTILDVLAPIEAPSMHALCSMPTVQTNRIFGISEEQYQILKDINADCDKRVSDCFFSILDMFEKGNHTEDDINLMIENNILFGKMIADRLVENHFVRSPESLYYATSYI